MFTKITQQALYKHYFLWITNCMFVCWNHKVCAAARLHQDTLVNEISNLNDTFPAVPSETPGSLFPQGALLPMWWFCCCGRWRTGVHWGLSSSPSQAAESSAVSCAGTWGSCRGTAGETVGWRRCPSPPVAPGCCWLPGTKMEKLRYSEILVTSIRLKDMHPKMDEPQQI